MVHWVITRKIQVSFLERILKAGCHRGPSEGILQGLRSPWSVFLSMASISIFNLAVSTSISESTAHS